MLPRSTSTTCEPARNARPSACPPRPRYVDVVLQLIKSAGDNVSEEIWYRVVQIITNQGEDLQKYATETVWRALQSDPLPHRTLVKVAGYVLGEFGHMIADVPGSGAVQQLELLHAQFAQGAPDTRALLLNTYVKLAHTYQEILPQVDAVLRAQSAAMDQELQQRATEYLALSDAHLGTIKSSVLEMMPPFTERESVVQKQLAKSQGEPGAPQVDPLRSEGGAVVRDDKLPPQPESAPSDLIGGLDLDAQPAAPAPASIDLLGETMAPTPAPPPAAPAATAADDLLGLMSDIPTPTAQGASQATAHNGAGDLLDGLSSLTSPNPTQHATPPAADDVARWTALCLRDNGVLHEDAAIQARTTSTPLSPAVEVTFHDPTRCAGSWRQRVGRHPGRGWGGGECEGWGGGRGGISLVAWAATEAHSASPARSLPQSP